jgi:translation elongation factor EF-1beta
MFDEDDIIDYEALKEEAKAAEAEKAAAEAKTLEVEIAPESPEVNTSEVSSEAA